MPSESGGVELGAVGGDFEGVGLVFAEFLNFFAGVIGVDDERGACGASFDCLAREQCRSDDGVVREKTIGGVVKAWLDVAGKSDGEARVDAERAGCRFDVGGLRHQVQRYGSATGARGAEKIEASNIECRTLACKMPS